MHQYRDVYDRIPYTADSEKFIYNTCIQDRIQDRKKVKEGVAELSYDQSLVSRVSLRDMSDKLYLHLKSTW
jgi:hypothetical protein